MRVSFSSFTNFAPVLLVLSLGCRLSQPIPFPIYPVSTEARLENTPTAISLAQATMPVTEVVIFPPIAPGTWRGALRELNGRQREFTMHLLIEQVVGSDIFGRITLEEKSAGGMENYQVSGTYNQGKFTFREAEGRHFWGTYDGNRLIGQVAWDCFGCSGWGNFELDVTSETKDVTPVDPGKVDFLDLVDGGSLIAIITPENMPLASVRCQALTTDGRLAGIGLEADGIQVAYSAMNGNPTDVTLTWHPWHGNGEYVLEASILDWSTSQVIASRRMTIQVTGIPPHVPSIGDGFRAFYQKNFNLSIDQPVFLRYNKPVESAVDESRWVSTVYVGNTLYALDWFDHGFIGGLTYEINRGENGFCKPAGSYRMLVLFVDYGNTGIGQAEAESALFFAQDRANQRWLEISKTLGWKESLLRVQAETVTLTEPPTPGELVTPDEILELTGKDASQYDLLAEIDLDRENRIAGQFGGLGISLNGGCRPGGANRANFAFSATDLTVLNESMGGSLFEHELMHGMGWMHWWANEDGSNQAWLDTRNFWLPWKLFGWGDEDGDGLPEIMDPNPYHLP